MFAMLVTEKPPRIDQPAPWLDSGSSCGKRANPRLPEARRIYLDRFLKVVAHRAPATVKPVAATRALAPSSGRNNTQEMVR